MNPRFKDRAINKNSYLYRSLFPNDAKVFIGGKNSSGQYIPHLTENLTPDELVNFIVDTFGSKGVTQDDLIEFSINIEDMLNHHTQHIVDMLNQGNNELFNRLIAFNVDGTFRSFTVFYDRLINGDLDQATILNQITHVNHIYAHFFQKFNSFSFTYNKIGDIEHIFNHNGYINPVFEVAETFYMLIDVLLMHMAYEYFGQKKSFSKDKVISESLKSIRSALYQLFNTPSHYSDVFVAKAFLQDQEEFKQIELLSAHKFTHGSISKIIMDVAKPIYEYNNTEFEINLQMPYGLGIYFNILLELMGRLNHVEQMYETLKANAASPNEAQADGDVDHQFKLTFLAPVTTNLPSTEQQA